MHRSIKVMFFSVCSCLSLASLMQTLTVLCLVSPLACFKFIFSLLPDSLGMGISAVESHIDLVHPSMQMCPWEHESILSCNLWGCVQRSVGLGNESVFSGLGCRRGNSEPVETIPSQCE